ncbi:MAG TPA: alkaline phosphatase PhoX [Polyangia bacterium]
MSQSRRLFMKSGAAFAALGSMSKVLTSASRAAAHGRRHFAGYGPLLPDPAGVLDLPAGFSYRTFSRTGDPMTYGGVVPASHDGMAAFSAGFLGTWLVRNHAIDLDDVNEDGLAPVPAVKGATYDPEGVGGTTTLLIGRHGKLLGHWASLAGTLNNCAGGPTPWDTWLTCEEDDSVLAKPHGYVFEVDPWLVGNPRPITGMGRFEHEAVAFDRWGTAYLTEDAGGPFGCVYRFRPQRPLRGRGSLHAGGALTAMAIEGALPDLSVVQEPGTRLGVRWIDVPNPDPGEDDTPVREQVIAAGATPIMKAEGIWTGNDGTVWFVSSRGDGPDAEDEEDRSVAVHAGQIWRFDPRSNSVELVVIFPGGSPYDGPDNITVGPHGFALACTDGEDDQWLVALTEEGASHPFARNAFSDDEFAGATFSPDGETLYANLQGEPALTFAITGPWNGRSANGR